MEGGLVTKSRGKACDGQEAGPIDHQISGRQSAQEAGQGGGMPERVFDEPMYGSLPLEWLMGPGLPAVASVRPEEVPAATVNRLK